MLKYVGTQKPHTSDDVRPNENRNVYVYNDKSTNISANVKHTSYQNGIVNKAKQPKYIWGIIGLLSLLLVLFMILFIWAIATRGNQNDMVAPVAARPRPCPCPCPTSWSQPYNPVYYTCRSRDHGL